MNLGNSKRSKEDLETGPGEGISAGMPDLILNSAEVSRAPFHTELKSESKSPDIYIGSTCGLNTGEITN